MVQAGGKALTFISMKLLNSQDTAQNQWMLILPSKVELTNAEPQK